MINNSFYENADIFYCYYKNSISIKRADRKTGPFSAVDQAYQIDLGTYQFASSCQMFKGTEFLHKAI